MREVVNMRQHISDEVIKEIAKDIFNAKLNSLQIKMIRIMAGTGELKRKFHALPRDKQDKIKNKYGNLLDVF